MNFGMFYFDKILGKCGFAASVSSKPLLILSETVSDTISIPNSKKKKTGARKKTFAPIF